MLLTYSNIKSLIGRFLKEYAIDDTNYVESMPQWVEDAIEIIGIPHYYVIRRQMVKILQNRAPLPCNIDSLHGVYVSASLSNIAPNVKELKKLTIRNAYNIGKDSNLPYHDHAYGSIDGGFLNTSFPQGYAYYVYRGLPLDDEGFPQVPNNTDFTIAIFNFFIYRMSLSGYKHPVIDFNTAFQMWEKHYPIARNSLNMMDRQDMEEFTTMWTNPILSDLAINNNLV